MILLIIYLLEKLPTHTENYKKTATNLLVERIRYHAVGDRYSLRESIWLTEVYILLPLEALLPRYYIQNSKGTI
jgi:hypothetical protein